MAGSGQEPDAGDILETISNTLKYMAQAGCAGFDCPEKIMQVVNGLDRNPTSAADDLKELQSLLGNCRRCKLCNERTNIVFGTGDPDARLVFVGEGP